MINNVLIYSLINFLILISIARISYKLNLLDLPKKRGVHLKPTAYTGGVALCLIYAFAIFLYVIINMSMVLGLLPIVGSPLPIMSYGGSSLLAIMIGFSVVMSAKIYHNQSIS